MYSPTCLQGSPYESRVGLVENQRIQSNLSARITLGSNVSRKPACTVQPVCKDHRKNLVNVQISFLSIYRNTGTRPTQVLDCDLSKWFGGTNPKTYDNEVGFPNSKTIDCVSTTTEY